MSPEQKILYRDNSNFRNGYNLGYVESLDGGHYRHFQGECQDYINGYACGFAAHAWQALADAQWEAECLFAGTPLDSVQAWDTAEADDHFHTVG